MIHTLKRIRFIPRRLICCLLFCQLLLVNSYASAAWPQPEPGIDAQAGAVIDIDSGAILYEKDADTLYPPASTTKVLTALLVMENCDNLDEMVTISQEAMDRVESDSGNSAGVSAGDQMTVRDCLYALLLQSSNQTANALAEHVAGSIDEFVVMMNDRVKEMGVTDSHFENPSGLNGDTHHVTARELAVISAEAYKNSTLIEINSALTYQLPPTQNYPGGLTLENEHRLIKTTDESSAYYYPAVKAGKTGFLRAAGNTLVTYAEQDGRRLVSVVLKGGIGTGDPRQYFIDGKTMLEYGFANFTNTELTESDYLTFTAAEQESLAAQEIDAGLLTLGDHGFVSMPNGVSVSDLERTLVYELPAGHPADAAALLQYRYGGRTVGQAYLNLAQVAEPDPAPGAESEAAVLPVSNPDADLVETNSVSLPVIIVILLLIVAVGGGAAFIWWRQKEEQRQMQIRRQKRKQRLEELGVSQKEFEEMVEARRKPGKR